jgi:hypothetical protein
MTGDVQETPQERRARYLSLASEARQRAAHSSDGAIHDHYLKLATGWAALAGAVEDTPPKAMQDPLARR